MMNVLLLRILSLVALVIPISAQGVLTYPDIIYYKFNEGSGKQIVNWANPGNQQHSPQWAIGVGGMWDTGNARYGPAALDFAGIDRLLTGWPTNLNQSFTIECWIRVNIPTMPPCGTGQASICRLERLFGDYDGGLGFFRCYLGQYNPGANYLGGGFNGTWAANGLQSSMFSVTDGAWHHIALVHDQAAATVTSFVDGQLDQQATGVTVAGMAANANFNLGGTGDSTSITGLPFNGTVDEFRVWGEVRSQAQIQSGMMGEIPESGIRATFAGSPRRGPAHLAVAFRDFSYSPAGTHARVWNFGDGTTSTLEAPCHAYIVPGLYTVSLTVTDSSGSDTLTFTDFIDVGSPELTVQSCGSGDLYLAPPAPPPGWSDGYSLISLTPLGPVGGGWFFGIYPDAYTFAVLQLPPLPGSPLHFVNDPNFPNVFPVAPLYYPGGTFPFLSGLVMDTVLVYRNATGLPIAWTSVSRTAF